MNINSQIKPASEYISRLRPLLPPDAFKPDSRSVWRISLNLALVCLGYVLLRESGGWWVGPLCALLIGHSLVCLAFIAHDVSHNAVVRNKGLRTTLEFLLWGLNFIPPTVWRRVHNQTHHVETNTRHDPDRPFRKNERSLATWAYTRIFYPNRRTPLRQPLFFFHFIAYILRNVIASLLPERSRLSVVPYRPAYSPKAQFSIILELMIICVMQYIVWVCVGKNMWCYFWASPAAILVVSSVAMTYVFTNHFLNPLCEETDPLRGSTSVIVPRWMDWMHDNFSYHTEHHVFPGMNPRYYPQVSVLLQEHFPSRYNRIPLAIAWQRIWQQEEFIRENRPVE